MAVHAIPYTFTYMRDLEYHETVNDLSSDKEATHYTAKTLGTITHIRFLYTCIQSITVYCMVQTLYMFVATISLSKFSSIMSFIITW